MRPDDRQTRAQEGEYAFPYHYIPTLKGSKFSSTRHWDWGFRYLGGMQLALDQLADAKFAALIDIGCGVGRFLREVAGRFPGARLLGIDAQARLAPRVRRSAIAPPRRLRLFRRKASAPSHVIDGCFAPSPAKCLAKASPATTTRT